MARQRITSHSCIAFVIHTYTYTYVLKCCGTTLWQRCHLYLLKSPLSVISNMHDHMYSTYMHMCMCISMYVCVYACKITSQPPHCSYVSQKSCCCILFNLIPRVMRDFYMAVYMCVCVQTYFTFIAFMLCKLSLCYNAAETYTM